MQLSEKKLREIEECKKHLPNVNDWAGDFVILPRTQSEDTNPGDVENIELYYKKNESKTGWEFYQFHYPERDSNGNKIAK